MLTVRSRAEMLSFYPEVDIFTFTGQVRPQIRYATKTFYIYVEWPNGTV